MRKTRACVAVVAVAMAFGSFASAAKALPTDFWGIVPQATPSDEQFQRLARGGVESVRIPIGWAGTQPGQGGQFDWSVPDTLVGGAAKAGLDVLPFVTGAPAWAVPELAVPGTGNSLKAPGHLPVSGAAAGAWKTFLTATVARYGRNGSFWASNPAIPAHPVSAWQVWNEPNFKYFVARPNPGEYGKLVKISAAAIRAADPTADVVLAGLFARPKEGSGRWKKVKPRRAYFATEFLDQMYKRTPGVKKLFDGVALHPYTYDYPELAPSIEALRGTLKRHGDAGKGLWITELGWSSQPASSANRFAKGVAGQATQLRGSFGLLRAKQRQWKIKRLYWFSVDDQKATCNFCDGSGLFRTDFVPKKAWFDYVRFTGGSPN